MSLKVWLTVCLLLLIGGCAKLPGGGGGGSVVRIAFTMDVSGQLHTGLSGGGLPYVYIIALNLSTDEVPTTQGPIPVTVPAGNGRVAGEATHFVLWNPLASPQYQIYKFQDATMNQWVLTGTPVAYTPTAEGDRRLSFEIDLSQLVAAIDVPTIKSIQVNFLSMNHTNVSGGGRIWDALGDGSIPSQVNSPFTFRTNQAQLFNNLNQGSLEPTGDAIDPDLDISDWSVEVRLQ